MQNQINLLIVAALLGSTLLAVLPVSAQQIIRHPDGGVEVIDEYPLDGPAAQSSLPSHPAARTAAHSGRSHVSSGKIPAYRKHMGGVTVVRHADGTVDVVDDSTSSAPARRRSTAHHAGSSHRSNLIAANSRKKNVAP